MTKRQRRQLAVRFAIMILGLIGVVYIVIASSIVAAAKKEAIDAAAIAKQKTDLAATVSQIVQSKKTAKLLEETKKEELQKVEAKPKSESKTELKSQPEPETVKEPVSEVVYQDNYEEIYDSGYQEQNYEEQEEVYEVQETYQQPEYNGETLNSYNGMIQGPSGTETYYNLPMEGVIGIMRENGYSEADYPYWVRDDGVKMFGDYVMIAADFSIRPLGSLVETSLGTGIVCDTGTFIYTNPYQVDLAVNW